MTTVPAVRNEQVAALPTTRPAQLPPALTAEHQVPGFRNPMWQTVELRPEEHIAVQQALLEIELRLKPATPEEISVMLKELADYYGLKAEEDALTTKFEMMIEDLLGFSAAHIRHAIREHRRTNNWYPKSAELRNAAIHRQAYANMMRRRARILLGLEEPKFWEVPRPPNGDGGAPIADLNEKLAALPPGLRKATAGLLEAARTDNRRTSQHAEE